jgi:uncharacterized membrane protein
MKNKYSKIEVMLLFSVMFSLLLLFVRVIFSQKPMYIFFGWNFILATVPLVISRRILRCNDINAKTVLLLVCWLLFFPNAPYIITDILHFAERPPVPKWFDMMLVTSAAWNGLMLGIVSLMQVEEFLLKHFRERTVRGLVLLSLTASAFGIYLGRFMRFNSWDVVTDPVSIVVALVDRVANPFNHARTWSFTLLFGMFISIIYYTVKQLSVSIFIERKAE